MSCSHWICSTDGVHVEPLLVDGGQRVLAEIKSYFHPLFWSGRRGTLEIITELNVWTIEQTNDSTQTCSTAELVSWAALEMRMRHRGRCRNSQQTEHRPTPIDVPSRCVRARVNEARVMESSRITDSHFIQTIFHHFAYALHEGLY